MTLLEIFFIISGIIILIVAVDIARRERFNALHFVVFIAVWLGLLLFSFAPQALDLLGRLLGLNRGADALVYSGIVFLFYFSLLLLQKIDGMNSQLTRLVRELALQQKLHVKNWSK
jgi:hypothetical protein